MTDEPSTPSLRGFVEELIDAQLVGLRVALPAVVTAYDEDRQVCDAKPLVDQGYVDEDGVRRVEVLPIVTGVPVMFQGSGKRRTTFPISAGDTVLLVFASSSISRWKAGGGTDPGDDRHHRLSDAIAIPGLNASPPTTAPMEAVVVHTDSSELRLGGPTAAQPLTRASDVQAALVGALSDPAVAAAIAGVSAPGGAAALVVAVNNHFASNPVGGSPKVKAE